jgi:hypothetical protein
MQSLNLEGRWDETRMPALPYYRMVFKNAIILLKDAAVKKKYRKRLGKSVKEGKQVCQRGQMCQIKAIAHINQFTLLHIQLFFVAACGRFSILSRDQLL